MGPCRWAGLPCPNEAEVAVRLPGVGDREICREHVAVLDRLGMSYRPLGPDGQPVERRAITRAQAGSVPAQSGVAPPTREALPAAPSRPAWLARLQAKDMTGALR